MVLSETEAQAFFQAWLDLLAYVNDEYGLAPGFGNPTSPEGLDPEEILSIRDKLWEDVSVIDRYISSVWDMPPERIAIYTGWKNCVQGTFFILKHLKKYSVLIHEESVYGVVGITNPLGEMFPTSAPVIVKAVLIPFMGRIIHDSLLLPYNVYVGGNIKRELNEMYREAKAENRIITSL